MLHILANKTQDLVTNESRSQTDSIIEGLSEEDIGEIFEEAEKVLGRESAIDMTLDQLVEWHLSRQSRIA